MAIEAKALDLGYGEKTVVRNLTLRIEPGTLSSVIGPNGCGKSTLLKGIARTLPLKKGVVSILGKSVKQYNGKELARRLAFLAQAPHIPEQFSVRELVSYGRYPYAGWFGRLGVADHRIIDRAMERTGVCAFANRELVHLSGGERQRVWIAMALAQEAEVLLLDEPTTFLDIAHQFQTLELIKELQREGGITVLMVLHDLNQAARYSDRIFVMKDGALVKDGTADDVITRQTLREVFSIDAKIIRDDAHGVPFFIPLGEYVQEGVC